ncbi:Hypothetical predicted protein [Pelobates cultripes]|uniref:Uncharacterized protein n=1 Tax=Pelobates cultripes TaxID=61616 RepID=A0AAD1S8V9_PELCU|nr:Hypothetical predicted protein [Pelobates cultripes]
MGHRIQKQPEIQHSEQVAVGATADPKIGSFEAPEGYAKLWGLRPTREGSWMCGRHPVSNSSSHTVALEHSSQVPFPPLWTGRGYPHWMDPTPPITDPTAPPMLSVSRASPQLHHSFTTKWPPRGLSWAKTETSIQGAARRTHPWISSLNQRLTELMDAQAWHPETGTGPHDRLLGCSSHHSPMHTQNTPPKISVATRRDRAVGTG